MKLKNLHKPVSLYKVEVYLLHVGLHYMSILQAPAVAVRRREDCSCQTQTLTLVMRRSLS